MSFPSGQSIAVDPVATNWSIAKKQGTDVYIARQVLRELPITGGKQTCTYHIWNAGSFMRHATARPAGNPLARATGGIRVRGKLLGSTTGTVAAQEYAFEMALDRRLASRADDALRLRLNYQDIVTQALLDEQEQRMIDLAFATASVTQNTTLSSTDQWSDYTNSSPIAKINTGIDTIATGSTITEGELGYELCFATRIDVWRKLQRHPELQTQLGSNERKTIDMSAFMSMFNFKQGFIGRRMKDNVDEGQTASLAYMMADDFLIFYRPTGSVGFESRVFGVSAFEQDLLAKTYDEPQTNSDILMADHSTDELLPMAASGYLIKDCLA